MCLTSLVAIAFFTKAPVEVDADSIPNGQKLDTIVDTISVSDLTFNGLSNQTMVVHNERKNTCTVDFSGENTNKNLVFKFIYDVVDDTNSSSIQTRIHFDVGDDVTAEDKINILNIQGLLQTLFQR